tara:strand:+ start:209 stop:466 length:258 start_codon:yes stop_codon:yes gene_type:complete
VEVERIETQGSTSLKGFSKYLGTSNASISIQKMRGNHFLKLFDVLTVKFRGLGELTETWIAETLDLPFGRAMRKGTGRHLQKGTI